MFFEEEYRKIIEQLKKNEDYAVMRTICENIVEILKENGVKVDGTIVKNVTRAKTFAVVDDFDVKFNGLDFTEHDKKYVEEINDLKKQISELESKLETSKHLFDIKYSSKEFSWKSPTEYKKELCKTYTLEEMAGVVVDLEKQLNEMQEIANKYGDKCSELESELAVKEDLLKIAMREHSNSVFDSLRTAGIDEEFEEEPLPFSDEPPEEDAVELPAMPIDVAAMLINATTEYQTSSLTRAFGAGETSFADKYSKNDLKEIAEHLLVYCNNSGEEDGD